MSRSLSFVLAALCGVLLWPALSSAAPITILNHSFESPGITGDGNTGTFADDSNSGAPPNWTNSIGGMQTREPGSFFADKVAPTPDPADNASEQYVWSNGGTYMYQVLGTNYTANTVYTLQVDIGDRNDTPFGGAEVRLGTSATLGVNVLSPTLSSTSTPADGDWATWSFTFVSGPAPPNAGEALRVELRSLGVQTLFDNVRLDATPVPEPSALALACCALAAVGVTWLRRR